MTQPRKYLNYLELKRPIFGNERRYEMLKEVLDGGTFLPKAVQYEDIDSAFKDWVENRLKISYNGKNLPTMVLYSNQRFTEYSQTWKYTDENKNLILNFKTITRENNPEYGHIQSGLWNIPGDRFYVMKKQVVLDDNGSESFLTLKMRQPMAVDFIYTVSIFTTNFESINEFNRIVNNRFKARQDYINPNGYYMPMTLENITDKSSYQIDDRQFYSQSFEIKVMGYVLTEEDFRVEEQPLKVGVKFSCGSLVKNKADIEVEEYENPCNEPEDENEVYFKPIKIVITFPHCVKDVNFDLDTNFFIDDLLLENIKNNYIFYLNDEKVPSNELIGLKISDGSNVKIKIEPIRVNTPNSPCIFTLFGHTPDIAYLTEEEEPEIDADFNQYEEEIDVVSEEDADCNENE